MTAHAPLRGLILDLDGLLIDSERWNWQAHNAVLARIGVAPLTLAEMRTLTGLSDEAESQHDFSAASARFASLHDLAARLPADAATCTAFGAIGLGAVGIDPDRQSRR